MKWKSKIRVWRRKPAGSSDGRPASSTHGTACVAHGSSGPAHGCAAQEQALNDAGTGTGTCSTCRYVHRTLAGTRSTHTANNTRTTRTTHHTAHSTQHTQHCVFESGESLRKHSSWFLWCAGLGKCFFGRRWASARAVYVRALAKIVASDPFRKLCLLTAAIQDGNFGFSKIVFGEAQAAATDKHLLSDVNAARPMR